MVTQLAAGTLGTKDVADWLAPRLRPSGPTAATINEAPMHESTFERFTDRARQAVILAQDEARRLGHDSVGPEHVLLGLLAVGEGIAAEALESLGISLEETRDRIGEGGGGPPSTPRQADSGCTRPVHPGGTQRAPAGEASGPVTGQGIAVPSGQALGGCPQVCGKD